MPYLRLFWIMFMRTINWYCFENGTQMILWLGDGIFLVSLRAQTVLRGFVAFCCVDNKVPQLHATQS